MATDESGHAQAGGGARQASPAGAGAMSPSVVGATSLHSATPRHRDDAGILLTERIGALASLSGCYRNRRIIALQHMYCVKIFHTMCVRTFQTPLGCRGAGGRRHGSCP